MLKYLKETIVKINQLSIEKVMSEEIKFLFLEKKKHQLHINIICLTPIELLK